MTIFARGFAASLLLMVAGTCVAAEPLAPVDPEDRRHFDALEKFVDGMVKPLMQDNKSPSGTVAVRHRGELIFAKG